MRFLAPNRSAMLNQNISVTAKQYGDAPRLMSVNILRKHRVGLGWEPTVCPTSKLTKATDWTSEGHDTKFIQVLTGNDGNLQRRAK